MNCKTFALARLAFLAAAFSCAVVSFGCRQDQPPPDVVHVGGSLGVDVNAEGIGKVTLADGTTITPDTPGIPMQGPNGLAGGLAVEDGAPVFVSFHPEATNACQPFGDRLTATLAKVGAAAVVTHDYQNATAKHTYTVSGTDLTAHIELLNKASSTKPLRYLYLRHLRINGQATAGSTAGFQPPQMGWGPDYIGPAGPYILHQRGGGHVAFSEGYGLGVWTKGLGHAGRLASFWNHAVGAWVDKEVLPGQSVSFDVRCRFDRVTDRDALLSGWYADHAADSGPLQYNVDHRPMLVFQRANNPQADANHGPYGDHEYPTRGFHDPAAAESRGDYMGRFAGRAGCQGVILWTGLYYPKAGQWGFESDFHDLPVPVKQALPAFTGKLASYGVSNGVLARLAYVPRWRAGIAAGQAVSLEDTTWADRDEMLGRFLSIINGPLQSRRSYLDDSITYDIESVLAYVRAGIGRDYQIWCELPTDFTITSGGIYAQAVKIGGVIQLDKQDAVDIYRKMYPQIPVAVINAEGGDQGTGMDLAAFVGWCADHRYTALLRDHPICYAVDWQAQADIVKAAYQDKLIQRNGGYEWPDLLTAPRRGKTGPRRPSPRRAAERPEFQLAF